MSTTDPFIPFVPIKSVLRLPPEKRKGIRPTPPTAGPSGDEPSPQHSGASKVMPTFRAGEMESIERDPLRRHPMSPSKAGPPPEAAAECSPASDSPPVAAPPAWAKPTPEPAPPPDSADLIARKYARNLKLPAFCQIQIAETILAGGDVVAVALDLLQQHLTWPGQLQLAPPTDVTAAVPEPTPEAPASAAVRFEQYHFGTLGCSNPSAAASSTEQLLAAATWLAAVLALAQQYQHLLLLSNTDELSGAYNRRYFLEKVPRLLVKARQERFCVTILLFDIDDFKKYNDQFGHAAGDAIIREIIRMLRHCTRSRDLVARIGGDEFAVVFWDEGPARHPDSQHPRNVLSIAQRFRKEVAEHPWNAEDGPIPGRLSISGGLATFPWDARTAEELLAVADAELLRAKSLGKNVVVLAGPGAGEPASSSA